MEGGGEEVEASAVMALSEGGGGNGDASSV